MQPAPAFWRSFCPVRITFSPPWTTLLKPHTVIIKYFKATPVQLPSTPHEPLRDAVGISASRGASSLPQTNASGQRLPASGSPAFDLAVARASAGLEIASFLGLMVASTGTLYALADTIGSFAVGFPPAMQALALHIYTDRRSQNKGEIGKLFGALSVIQALGYVFSGRLQSWSVRMSVG